MNSMEEDMEIIRKARQLLPSASEAEMATISVPIAPPWKSPIGTDIPMSEITLYEVVFRKIWDGKWLDWEFEKIIRH